MLKEKKRKRVLLGLVVFGVLISVLGIFLPEMEPTPLTYINASSINTTGATATGSLQNITDINHGYYNVSEINAQPWYVIVNFTNITNFSFLEVKAKYFSTSATPSSHIVDLEIFCKTDQEYEDLFFLENAAEWRYFTRHFPDSEHFIDAQGNVSIKFNHSANGNVNHRMLIDVVRLAILPQYAQNTVTLNQYFNTTGGGCTGNCAFNNLTVNSLGKNNTLDAYGGYINLFSPFKNIVTNHEKTVDFTGFDITWNILDTTTNNFSQIVMDPDSIILESTNGTSSNIVITHDYIDINTIGTIFRFTPTNFSISNANITDCANCATKTDLSTKVNKTGDIMTGNLTVQKNITILTDQTDPYLQNYTIATSVVNPPQNAGLNMIQQDTWQSFSMFTYANSTLGSTFGGHMARYNSTTHTLYPLLSGDAAFYFFMKGWDGSSWTSSRARIYMETAGNWNSTSHPSQIRIGTTSSTDVTNYTTVTSDGSIKMDRMAGGTGNAYVCVNKSTGTLYVGNPGC